MDLGERNLCARCVRIPGLPGVRSGIVVALAFALLTPGGTVDVPGVGAARFALEPLRNPSHSGRLRVTFSLPSATCRMAAPISWSDELELSTVSWSLAALRATSSRQSYSSRYVKVRQPEPSGTQ